MSEMGTELLSFTQAIDVHCMIVGPSPTGADAENGDGAVVIHPSNRRTRRDLRSVPTPGRCMGTDSSMRERVSGDRVLIAGLRLRPQCRSFEAHTRYRIGLLGLPGRQSPQPPRSRSHQTHAVSDRCTSILLHRRMSRFR